MIVSQDDVDYSHTLLRYFGRKGWYFGMIVFIAMLAIPMILYM